MSAQFRFRYAALLLVRGDKPSKRLNGLKAYDSDEVQLSLQVSHLLVHVRRCTPGGFPV